MSAASLVRYEQEQDALAAARRHDELATDLICAIQKMDTITDNELSTRLLLLAEKCANAATSKKLRLLYRELNDFLLAPARDVERVLPAFRDPDQLSMSERSRWAA